VELHRGQLALSVMLCTIVQQQNAQYGIKWLKTDGKIAISRKLIVNLKVNWEALQIVVCISRFRGYNILADNQTSHVWIVKSFMIA
jgi:hypothetical protein